MWCLVTLTGTQGYACRALRGDATWLSLLPHIMHTDPCQYENQKGVPDKHRRGPTVPQPPSQHLAAKGTTPEE